MQLDEIPRARLSTVARRRRDARVGDEALRSIRRRSIRWRRSARGPTCARADRQPMPAVPRHRRRRARARLVGERARDLSRLSVQVFRAARAEARGRARRRRGDGPAAAGAVRARGVRDVLQRVAGGGHRAITPANLDGARELFTAVVDRALERAARRPRRGSSARACSVRRRRRASARRCSGWRPSGRSPVVERLLEHGSSGDVHDRDRDGPRDVALRGKADRVDLLEDGTFRLIDYKLGGRPIAGAHCSCRSTASAPNSGSPAIAAAAGARRGGVSRVQGTAARRAAVLVARRTREVLAEAQQRLVEPSTRSRAASFRRRRTMSGAARRAASRRCAGRTMSAMSEPRLPFDDGDGDRAAGTPSPTARSTQPIADARATPSIRRGTSCSRRRPAPARRACSSSATSTCCAPASSRITSWRSRSPARPPPRCGERIIERLREASRLSRVRRGALARAQGAARRHRDLDDRRVLPVAAARVSARSRRRSRLRPGGRHRGAAAVAESLDQALRDLPRRRARRRRRGAGVRAARRAASAQRDWRAARSAAGRAAGAAALSLQRGPRDLTAATSRAERPRRGCATCSRGVRDGLDGSSTTGRSRHPQFAMLADDIARGWSRSRGPRRASNRAKGRRRFARWSIGCARYFLTQDGRPRGEKFAGTGFTARRLRYRGRVEAASRDGGARSRRPIAEAIRAFRRDLNVVLSRGVWRIFAVALDQYQRTLEAHALLDFSGVLERAVKLLKDMDEFAQSRFRLEARYRHVLVDEFQDTSRAQWELVAQLVRSWGEGLRRRGRRASRRRSSSSATASSRSTASATPTSALLDEAARVHRGAAAGRRAAAGDFGQLPVGAGDPGVRQRRVRGDRGRSRPDRRRDAFPVYARTTGFRCDPTADRSSRRGPTRRSALIVGDTVTRARRTRGRRDRRACCRRRDRARPRDRRRATGAPADIAILFRSRDSHREFEKALERRGVPTYVYKGLGFFDADEIQDAVALLRYLADPLSDLRAATLPALAPRAAVGRGASPRLGARLAEALLGRAARRRWRRLGRGSRVLERLRAAVPRWLAWVDRLPPSELLRRGAGARPAYAYELRGLAPPAGAREPEEAARHDPARPEPRLRDARPHRRAPRAPRGGRRVERRDRRGGCRQPDDGSRGERARVPDRVRGEHGPRHRGHPGADSCRREHDGEASVAIADYQSEADEDARRAIARRPSACCTSR